MLNTEIHLVENIFSDDIKRSATRDGFGTGVVEVGKVDERVMVLCADLSESTRSDEFARLFPKRFVEVGIAEQNMVGFSAGLASVGKVPFVVSYSAFSPGRNYEQIRTTIALSESNVRVCGMHSGVSVGADGATHQMLEDIGMMRMLPNMIVVNPADAEEARKAVTESVKIDTPMYLRFSRSATPVFTTHKTTFSFGKAITLWDSEKPRIAILATGPVVYRALLVARALASEGIESIVLNVHTIKPLDGDAILSAVQRTGRIITIEEHQVAGGFGSAVAEFLVSNYPVPMTMIGIQDRFGQSGEPDELLEEYGLGVGNIIKEVHKLILKN
ncbi:Transketolase, C-terminal section [hydrothermal vent metagenome]|uniref:Transketolase, C-terminal section n=1 Tax=hydrothermal vent metagenome TaxID=652676 RepID=A0A3B0VL75_9ZZZZ